MEKDLKLGVLYLAFGRAYLAMALNSLKTFRNNNSSIPVCIITNVTDKYPEFEWWNPKIDKWKYIELDITKNRNIKTALYDYTPFEKTIYLDTDTEVVRDITEADYFLDYFDICIKPTTPRDPETKGRHIVLDGKVKVSELPHWNSGIIFFRKNKHVEDFFKIWSQKFNEYFEAEGDQTSLVDAIFFSKCKLLSLDFRWNATLRQLKKDYGGMIKILHYCSLFDTRLEKDLHEIDDELTRQGIPEKGLNMSDHIVRQKEKRAVKEALRLSREDGRKPERTVLQRIKGKINKLVKK
jgi:hypothetical protein